MHAGVVVRRENDLCLLDVADDHIRHIAARRERRRPALELWRIAELLECVDKPGAEVHFFFFLAPHRKIPLDALSKFVHLMFLSSKKRRIAALFSAM